MVLSSINRLFLILEQMMALTWWCSTLLVTLRICLDSNLTVSIQIVHWAIWWKQISFWNFGRIIAVKIAHAKWFFVFHVFFYPSFASLLWTHWRASVFMSSWWGYRTLVLSYRKIRRIYRNWFCIKNPERWHVLHVIIIEISQTRFFGIIDLWRVSDIL